MRYRSLLIFVILAMLSTMLCPSISGAANYTYDALNRLIRVDYDNGTYVEYSYDEVGNRLQTGGNQGFTITASAGTNGSISPAGTIPINNGGSQVYTITPSTGFFIANVTVDGTSVGAVSSYTFSNVTANHRISATFSTAYTISGTVTTSTGFAISGATVTLTGNNNQTASTTTDSSGNYSFTGLSNGSYTVTPSMTGYALSPANIVVALSGANITNLNFEVGCQ